VLRLYQQRLNARWTAGDGDRSIGDGRVILVLGYFNRKRVCRADKYYEPGLLFLPVHPQGFSDPDAAVGQVVQWFPGTSRRPITVVCVPGGPPI